MQKVNRQQRRQQERSEYKQQKQNQAYFNEYPRRFELLNLSRKIQEFDQIQDGLITLLMEKGIFTQQELQAVVDRMADTQAKTRQIVNEPDWKRRFEMCVEFGMDNTFLRAALDKDPSQVSKELLDELRVTYWPVQVIEEPHDARNDKPMEQNTEAILS